MTISSASASNTARHRSPLAGLFGNQPDELKSLFRVREHKDGSYSIKIVASAKSATKADNQATRPQMSARGNGPPSDRI